MAKSRSKRGITLRKTKDGYTIQATGRKGLKGGILAETPLPLAPTELEKEAAAAALEAGLKK